MLSSDSPNAKVNAIFENLYDPATDAINLNALTGQDLSQIEWAELIGEAAKLEKQNKGCIAAELIHRNICCYS